MGVGALAFRSVTPYASRRGPGAVGIDGPQALGDDGRPIAGQARHAFQPAADTPDRRLADIVQPWMGTFQALPAADVDEAGAVLTERDWFNGPTRTVERS